MDNLAFSLPLVTLGDLMSSLAEDVENGVPGAARRLESIKAVYQFRNEMGRIEAATSAVIVDENFHSPSREPYWPAKAKEKTVEVKK